MFSRQPQPGAHDRLKEVLAKRRQIWPDPELSIGQPRGSAGKKNLQYWEAVGPALDAYKELCPRIYNLLSDHQGPLPNSDFITTGIYMIGPSPPSAIPHIMFTSEDKRARENAQKIIKQSRVLLEHPGMNVGHWRDVPHLSAQRQCTAAEHPGDARHVPCLPGSIEIELSPGQTLLRVQFDFGEYSTTGTCGVMYVRNDRHYCLVPAHMLFPPIAITKPQIGTPDFQDIDSDDCEFGGFAPDDEELDETLSMSAGSVSSESSRSTENSANPRFDFESKEPSIVSESLTADPIESQILPSENTTEENAAAHNAVVENTKAEKPATQPGWPCFPVISVELDYALMEVPLLLAVSELSSMRRLREDTIRGLVEGPVAVEAITSQRSSHRLIRGTLTRSWSFVHLPGSVEYVEFYTALLDSKIVPGDSGLAICGQDDQKLYGYVITGGVHASSAYVIPAVKALSDIESRTLPQFDPAPSFGHGYPSLQLVNNGQTHTIPYSHAEAPRHPAILSNYWDLDAFSPATAAIEHTIANSVSLGVGVKENAESAGDFTYRLPLEAGLLSPPRSDMGISELDGSTDTRASPVVEEKDDVPEHALARIKELEGRLKATMDELLKSQIGIKANHLQRRALELELEDARNENHILKEEMKSLPSLIDKFTISGVARAGQTVINSSDLTIQDDLRSVSPPKLKRRTSRTRLSRDTESEKEKEKLRSRFDRSDESTTSTASIDSGYGSSRKRRPIVTYHDWLDPNPSRQPITPQAPAQQRSQFSPLSRPPVVVSAPRRIQPTVTYTYDDYPEDGHYDVHPLPRD